MSDGAWAAFRDRLLARRHLDLHALRPLLEKHLPELAGVEARRGEDVLQHTQAVLARLQPQLQTMPAERAQTLYLAGLLHDLGRGPLAAPAQRRSSHASAGAALARDALFRLQLPGPQRDHVVYLVRLHMLPGSFGAREAALPRMLRLAWTLDTGLLYRLAAADQDASEEAAGGPRAWPPSAPAVRSSASSTAPRSPCWHHGDGRRSPRPTHSCAAASPASYASCD